MSKLAISVIMPVYNTEKYLHECINSIFMQTFQNFEIIAVNDGSTDSSGQILDDYAQKHDNIKVIHKENEGAGYARKIGLDLAQGDYILFMDSDDYYEKDAFEKLYDNITANKSDIAIVEVYLWDFNTKTKVQPWYQELVPLFPEGINFNNFTFRHTDQKMLAFDHLSGPWSKIYSKKFLGRYDDLYFPKNMKYDDVPFHLQVILRAEKISICPYALYNYIISIPQSEMNIALKSKKSFDIFTIITELHAILTKENQLGTYETLFLSYILKVLFYCYYKIPASFKYEYYQKTKEILKPFSKDVINELEPWIKEIYIKYSKAETSIEFDLLNEKEKLFLELAQTKEQLDIKNNYILELNTNINALNANINEILSSWSFRIGSAVTKTMYFPIKLIKGK